MSSATDSGTIPELRALIETILPERDTIEAFEVDRVFPSIGRKRPLDPTFISVW
jgi:hypothetical protein